MDTTEPVYTVVLAAAGSGSRMGAELPKQYLTLCGQIVLQRTLTRVLQWPGVARVAAVVADEDDLFASLPAAADARVERVSGGATRAESVINGLLALDLWWQLQPGASAALTPWVLVHDAARPLVLQSDVEQLCAAVRQQQACGGLLATPVADTLKRACDEDHRRAEQPVGGGGAAVAGGQSAVQTTVARAQLWAAQTPQLFRLRELSRALQDAVEQGCVVTDESSAMEHAGFNPLLVPATGLNLKLTTPVDMQIAEAVLLTRDGTQHK